MNLMKKIASFFSKKEFIKLVMKLIKFKSLFASILKIKIKLMKLEHMELLLI